MNYTIEELYKQFVSKGESILASINEDCLSPSIVNEELLMKILYDNRDTEYGRKYGFENIRSAREYCKKIPLSDYDDYEPYIHRMIKNGETELITAYDVIQYVTTSGSVGVQKVIPMTNESMTIYEDSLFARTMTLAQQYLQLNGKTLPVGKCLNMLETESYVVENGMQCGSVSGSVSGRFRNIFSALMTSPEPVLIPSDGMNMNYLKARFALEEPEIVFIISPLMSGIVDLMNYIRSNWKMLVEDIENGTLCNEICNEEQRGVIMPYIKKDPKRAATLRKEFSKGFYDPIIPRIWKNMTWVCSVGSGGFASFTEKFRQYAGEDVAIDYFSYAASEGVFAVSTEMNDPRYAPLLRS
ncbi:MAG: GH3 auxin-responsive promoter family protein, partial [Firmicutes bacterium]|nr:GH3 auxin-responsive promoter family protein [Bacillota bacterium]